LINNKKKASKQV
jgi:hypothetical protein